MVRGLVIGKFWPLHKGHEALIDFAFNHCEEVSIIVCDGPRYDIPGSMRQEWLAKVYPRAQVHLTDEESLADNDSEGWAKQTRKVLGFIPDKVFTSEKYGSAYAHWLGCEHISFDPPRSRVPVSGTMIRSNPFAYWEYLNPVVRAYFVRRVALVGAESCGKSTLADALAREFKTYAVPEYGRYYWDAKKYAEDDPIWTTQEFVHIARRQSEAEDHFATRANKVLICDTNAFLTGIWHRRYLDFYAPEVDALAEGRKYDLVLYFPANIPFVQDGSRDGEAIRPQMSTWIRERLVESGTAFHTMTGPVQERTEIAVNLINKLIDCTKKPVTS